MKKNVIVGQSGGPTAVINASLAGVYKTAKDMGADTIYGMRYGIQGLLEKKIVDLGEKIRNDMDVELLKRTPASFLGSCRYKLPEISLISLLSYQVLSHIDRAGNQNDESFDHILHVHVDGQEVQCYEDDS